MEQSVISSNIQSNQPTQTDSRPLGRLSTFIVEQLPRAVGSILLGTGGINDFETDLRNSVRDAEADGVVNLLQTLDDDQRRLALLDLLVGLNAVKALGGVPPESLQALIEQAAADLHEVPWLTYDLIVRSNPLSDTRTFTGLTSEAEFYRRHELVEYEMSYVLASMKKIASCIMKRDCEPDEIAPHVEAVCDRLRKVEQGFAWFADLPGEEFSLFRRFFYEESGRPGPSGLFSAQTQGFSIILAGKKLGQSLERVKGLLAYYPTRDRETLQWTIDEAEGERSFFEFARSQDLPVKTRALLRSLLEGEKRILAIHRGIIRKNLPVEYAANAPGTGGRPIRSFIDSTVDLYSALIDELVKGEKA